jgi:hypothetical protein
MGALKLSLREDDRTLDTLQKFRKSFAKISLAHVVFSLCAARAVAGAVRRTVRQFSEHR